MLALEARLQEIVKANPGWKPILLRITQKGTADREETSVLDLRRGFLWWRREKSVSVGMLSYRKLSFEAAR
jgi:hypothetical protein